jgi:hypothetical protein
MGYDIKSADMYFIEKDTTIANYWFFRKRKTIIYYLY